MHELLTTEEMAEADRRAVVLGVPSLTLMENAGRAVADEAVKLVPPGARIVVLCGPGNNGGDGFVAAKLLRERGFEVRVACLVPVDRLKGDAADMAQRWGAAVDPLKPDVLPFATLIIDAIFGAGLSRDADPGVGQIIGALNSRNDGISLLSVDVPTGIDGNSGAVRGVAVRADRTVTFFRKKPGHLLMPGRGLCGVVVVADIGILDSVLENPPPPTSRSDAPHRRGEELGAGGISRAESTKREDTGATPVPGTQLSASILTPPPTPPRQGEGSLEGSQHSSGLKKNAFENHPSLWQSTIPWPRFEAHKYTRGHAVVVSGPAHQTGAARLAARGALRIGAGAVTIASPPSALLINAAHLTAIMLMPFGSARDFAGVLKDTRKNALLIGPGCGVGADTRDLTEVALGCGAAVVLDADALTSFATLDDASSKAVNFGFTSAAKTQATSPATLFAAIRAKPERAVVMTPHEGEFKRLFGEMPGSKLDRARAAAKLSGAIVVLKGADTVIAAPDGRAAINANAPPTLATAGSGDVLAGFIIGLLAQGMPAFAAACAAVWLHGECGNAFGPGLIAEDLPEVLPGVLERLRKGA